jgi:DNA helicase II / ATP-dependent DNA helicase PcrA
MPLNWENGALTPEQGDAIAEPGNVFVVACPGSGKTRTLTYKVVSELEKLDSRKNFVIAITYTHKAAEEIEERIASLGVNTEQLWIGTIHAFCLEWILKPYCVYHPKLTNGFSIINSHESELIITRLCSGMGITFFDCGFYFTGSTYELACLDARKHDAIHHVLSEYFDELKADRQIDFEMILQYAHELIQAKPIISQILSNLFEFIAVDEYQDTKRIQYEILMSIVKAGGGRTRTLIVGDPNQEIFTSLGGYAMSVEELVALIDQPVEVKRLSQNFRSNKRIIDYFENYNTKGTIIESASKDKDYPSLVTFNDTVPLEDLASEIARLIDHSVANLGISPNEICVLAPWWVHLASMTRTLVVRLPQYEFDGPGLVPFSRDQDNFWYKVARIALTEASPGMYVRRLRWAREIISDLTHCGVNTSSLSPRGLLRSSNSIELQTEDGLDYLDEYFKQLMDLLLVDFRAYGSLSEQHDAFFASSQVRIDRLVRDGAPFVRDIAIFRRVFRNRTGITVSTVHGVKGGEFDTVIAYGLLDGILPHFAEPDQEGNANKLLYVIASRARRNLHLIAERNRNKPWRGGMYDTTIPLGELEFDYDMLED